MTSPAAVPAIHTLVQLTTSDELVRNVRVEEIRGNRLVLSMPRRWQRPTVGRSVTLHWSAGPRGRWVLTGTVVDLPESRLTVEVDGEPEIEQHRQYVRGGGGEQIRMSRPGRPDETVGSVINISEQGVRAHFAGTCDVADGDTLDLRIHLDQATIEVRATALRVTGRATDGRAEATRLDIIAVFEPDETQAQAIRRYVLQQQVLNRSLLAALD